MGRRPPYLAANRRLGDPAELRLVRGVDREAWNRLKPHVTALPQATGINVNTAGPEVLAAVVLDWGAPRLALSRARRLAEATEGQPFETIEDFADAAGIEDESLDTGLIVTTQFFVAHTVARFGPAQHRLATLYHRSQGKARIVRHRTEIR